MRSVRMAAVGLVFAAAACTQQTIKTTGQSPSSGPPTAVTAHLGSAITLKGQDSNAQVQVTVIKILDPAKASTSFEGPAKGKRWVAVQVKLTNAGTAAYDDSPGNGAVLVDTNDQHFDPTIATGIKGGELMGSSVKLAHGESALGYLVFEIPVATTLARFQFTLDSGFGPETGEWTLS